MSHTAGCDTRIRETVAQTSTLRACDDTQAVKLTVMHSDNCVLPAHKALVLLVAVHEILLVSRCPKRIDDDTSHDTDHDNVDQQKR